MLREALAIAAALLVAGGVVGAAVTAACSDNNNEITTRRTNIMSTAGVTVVTGSGDLDNLAVSEADVGDEIAVTGTGWTGISPVKFYLLTKHETEGFTPGEVVNLGEVAPADDGAVSFRFRLASSYETPDGRRVRIEPGTRWIVEAHQQTTHGSQGAGVGPLTVK